MVKQIQGNLGWLEKISIKLTQWVGTPLSLIVHSILFIGVFSFRLIGIPLDIILLVLTTAVSLEAIYLAIFIQMTVNRSVASIESVRDDVEDLEEDVEDLEDDIKEITEDVEDIQAIEELDTDKALGQIEAQLQKVITELENMKQKSVPSNT